jgi:hypothetical protein
MEQEKLCQNALAFLVHVGFETATILDVFSKLLRQGHIDADPRDLDTKDLASPVALAHLLLPRILLPRILLS